MTKFLTKVAQQILDEKYYGPQSVVILPNKRSEVFLKEEIKKLTNGNLWLPEFFAIDEFITRISGFDKADNFSVSFDLYGIHQNIAKENAKTIDEFLTWAPVMLSDFNDIDNSMADAKEIFTQLSAVKAMQLWNPDGRPLTELQENYLHFFNSMFEYYSEITQKLKSSATGYQGLINRYAAENMDSLSVDLQWNNFFIVGLNALNQSELQVLRFINENYRASFLWDVDGYYFPTELSNNKTHEAGKHILNAIRMLKLPYPANVDSNFKKSKSTINILGIPKNVGQVKYIGQEIQNKFGKTDFSSAENDNLLSETAIVLSNENLLIPLLNSIPELTPKDKKYYNVTLGYPLVNSQIEHFFSSWIDLIITKNQNNGKLPTAQLMAMLNNPIFCELSSEKDNNATIKHIINNNISYVNLEDADAILKNSETISLVKKLLIDNKNIDVSAVLINFKNELVNLNSASYKVVGIAKEQIKQLIKIVSQLIKLSDEYAKIINYFAIKKIGLQMLSLSSINLVGKPLSGIQIMGLLETRNLDFKDVYILSANEGVLPKTTMMDSFIPMDIRREKKLPLQSDKADIYSYHFFRLLQRAENINIIYNSDADKLGGGEKSRFILQIENELKKYSPDILINNTIITTDIAKNSGEKHHNRSIVIKKNKDILKRITEIGEKGYSPSLLGNYIQCKLKFYFSNVLRIVTTTTTEQTVEANTFGTIVHAVLEEIYKPFINNQIDVEELKKHLKNTRSLLLTQFNIHYANGVLNSGKNLLVFEVAQKYIISFLKWDIKQQQQHQFSLQSTESKLVTPIEINGEQIVFKGIIDRIDFIDDAGRVRIIDYKTGKVLPRDLVVKEVEQLTTDPKFSKAFQVIYYAWLYNKLNQTADIESGIVSLRSISSGFMPVVLKEFDNISDYFDGFEQALKSIVQEILDEDNLLTQTDDEKRCVYCDYKSICNI